MSHSPVRMAILLSGRGSNARSIINQWQSGALPAVEPLALLSNKPDAPGLTLAQDLEVPIQTAVFPQSGYATGVARDEAMAQWLNQKQVQLLVLAGYNRILTPQFLAVFQGVVLNIHPSLLPRHGGVGMVGLAVHQAVLASGDTESGCTVHQVTQGVDEGPILGQAKVAVYPDDTPDSLAARILQQEHRLYPQVLQQVALALQQGASVQSAQLIYVNAQLISTTSNP